LVDRRPALSSNEGTRSGYSDEEVIFIYELALQGLENGQIRWAGTLVQGLVEVAPDYAPGWIARAYVYMYEKDYDRAVFCARQALRIQPTNPIALLYLVSCLLVLGDYNSAGTYLGEVSELIEAGKITDSKLIRLFRMLLARFQSRL